MQEELHPLVAPPSSSPQRGVSPSPKRPHRRRTTPTSAASPSSHYFSEAIVDEELEAFTARPAHNGHKAYRPGFPVQLCRPTQSLWAPITNDSYGLDLGKLRRLSSWEPQVVGYKAASKRRGGRAASEEVGAEEDEGGDHEGGGGGGGDSVSAQDLRA